MPPVGHQRNSIMTRAAFQEMSLEGDSNQLCECCRHFACFWFVTFCMLKGTANEQLLKVIKHSFIFSRNDTACHLFFNSIRPVFLSVSIFFTLRQQKKSRRVTTFLSSGGVRILPRQRREDRRKIHPGPRGADQMEKRKDGVGRSSNGRRARVPDGDLSGRARGAAPFAGAASGRRAARPTCDPASQFHLGHM